MIQPVDMVNNPDIVVTRQESAGAFKPFLVPVFDRPFGTTTGTVAVQACITDDTRGPERGQPPLDTYAGVASGYPHSVHTPTDDVEESTGSARISLTARREDAPTMAAVRPSPYVEAPAMKATVRGRPGHPGYPQIPAPIEERLADEAPLAVGAVLFRAHEVARHLENLLELEAVDPQIAALRQDTKRVRKSIAALLVDAAIAAFPEPREA